MWKEEVVTVDIKRILIPYPSLSFPYAFRIFISFLPFFLSLSHPVQRKTRRKTISKIIISYKFFKMLPDGSSIFKLQHSAIIPI
jgi:hypothetical protein